MKSKYIIILIVLFNLVFMQESYASKKFKVGLSVCSTSGTWKNTRIQLMQNELRYFPDIDLIVKDAKTDCELQEKHIEEFLNDGIDLLIVSANIMTSINSSIEKAHKRGVPIILIDRKIMGIDYTSYVGGNNYKIGYDVGEYAAKKLQNNGKVVEIKGNIEGASSIERSKGFRDAISKYPNIKIVLSEFGNWSQNRAKEIIQNAINSKLDFDLVFAHNDLMAIELSNILNKYSLNKKPYIIGIDGLPGPDGGIQAVIDGKIDATFYYPPHGEKIIQVANKILNHLEFVKDNYIEAVPVDLTNAKDLNSQFRQVQSLQEKIDRQSFILKNVTTNNKTLNLILVFAFVLMLLFISLIIMVYIANKNKIEANNLLEAKKIVIMEKNQSITEQQRELIDVTEKLKEATDSKLAFFSNISHEFKTPLTLITGPLEFLIKSKKFAFEDEQQLRLMYRNSLRLLRLVNQLIDFEKLENNQSKLNVSECDFKKFLKEKEETFRYLAKSKDIDFEFISEVSDMVLWIDCDKLDKVFFNLLSNAFKFTHNHGKIEIILRKPKFVFNKIYDQEVQIEIKDSGEGIDKTHIKKIFKQYFQSKKNHSNIGTGLGLSFTKKIVELHRGSIKVESLIGKGTTFYVRLPVGNKHFKKDELIESRINNNFILQPPTLLNTKNDKNKNFHTNVHDMPLILIVDDEPDMRKYLKYCLSDEYEIIEAINGKEAIRLALENEPDLIICDMIIPEMDGLNVIKNIKGDIKISHIPIILLTGHDSLENEFNGLQEGAESYILKPFDQKYLLSNVKNILKQRNRLKEYFKCNLEFQNTENDLSRLDRNFINNIEKIVNDLSDKEDITVEILSDKVGVSRVHLYRKIKKLTGMSVSEFLVSLKLKKSVNLLRNSDKSINDIAFEVGFSSQSYFTKCFKKQFKYSPTEYRNLQLGN